MSNIKETNFQAMSEYWNANISRVVKINGKYIPIADDQYLNYVTAKPAQILSGYVSADKNGKRITGTLKVSDSGLFDIAKVTEYSPYAPAVQLVTSVDVSGIGDLIWSDDPDSEDYEYNQYYSEANGWYYVTPETVGETDWKKRIYKHESKEYYLYYQDNEDYPEDSTWFIGESIGEGFVRKYNDYDWETDEMLPVGDLESGTSEWGDYDFEPFSVTLDVTTSMIPESPMVLKGVKAAGYSDGEWTFSTAATDFIGFDAVPQVGLTYAVFVDSLVGKSVDTILLKLSFDGDDVLADSSGYAHIVTREDGEILSEGYSGNAWNFNGGFLKIEPKGNEFVFGANDFTIEAYIYPNSDRRQCFFAYWSDRKFAICFSYDEDCRIGVFGGKHGWNNHYVSDPLELNKWYHIAIVRRRNTLHCYIDGKSTGYTVDMTKFNVGEQMAVSFGRWGNDQSDFDARWQGYMDDIRISNIARY